MEWANSLSTCWLEYNILILPFISQKSGINEILREGSCWEEVCFYFLTNRACCLIKKSVKVSCGASVLCICTKVAVSFSFSLSVFSLRPMGSWALGVLCFRTIGGMSNPFCGSNRASAEEVASARSVHPQPQATGSSFLI